jgi:hypothetical protein
VGETVSGGRAEGFGGSQQSSEADSPQDSQGVGEEDRRAEEEISCVGAEEAEIVFWSSVLGGAIHRVLRQNGLIRKRKKKWRKRRDLRELKAALKPLEKIILDGKHLNDIEHYWPQMRFKGLPSYQYTARDVRTGAVYFTFSQTNDSTSATIFL